LSPNDFVLLTAAAFLIFLFVECSGESSCKGFYVYDDKRKASRDPDFGKYIEKSRNMAGVMQDPKVMINSTLVFLLFF
jgi:enoyl-CoA hydratase/3-hydroxyacyl-CoA dehydrogenase